MKMSYYEQKRSAYGLIRNLLQQGKSRDEIRLKIANAYGFGRKIVDDYLDLIGVKVE